MSRNVRSDESSLYHMQLSEGWKEEVPRMEMGAGAMSLRVSGVVVAGAMW